MTYKIKIMTSNIKLKDLISAWLVRFVVYDPADYRGADSFKSIEHQNHGFSRIESGHLEK